MSGPAALRFPRFLVPTVALALFVAACGSNTSQAGDVAPSPSGSVEAFATSIATLPPLTDTGGKGQPVDGIQCGPEMVQYHIHAHLAILADGVNVLVPA